MVQINFASREVNCKLVYYGPGRCGKTTNLQVVHAKAPQNSKGELVSIATETDRTLYFDFLPLDLGTVAGMRTKFQLYTVPGQVYYDATRKLVLQGCDGIVFVADSNPDIMAENVESLDNLAKNLAENGLDINEIALVLQFNKRDLPNAVPIEELNAKLNRNNWPTVEACAVNGDGVFQTLKLVSQQVIKRLNREHAPAERPRSAKLQSPAAPPPPPRPPSIAPPPPPPPRPAAVAPPPPPPPPPAPVRSSTFAPAAMRPIAPAQPAASPFASPAQAATAPTPEPVLTQSPPHPAAPVMSPVPVGSEVPPATPEPAWRSKTDIFRERMAEIKKEKAKTAMPNEPAPPAPASGVQTISAAETPPQEEPKKTGCFGRAAMFALVVLAGAFEIWTRW
jgi:hypothetical protein